MEHSTPGWEKTTWRGLSCDSLGQQRKSASFSLLLRSHRSLAPAFSVKLKAQWQEEKTKRSRQGRFRGFPYYNLRQRCGEALSHLLRSAAADSRGDNVKYVNNICRRNGFCREGRKKTTKCITLCKCFMDVLVKKIWTELELQPYCYFQINNVNSPELRAGWKIVARVNRCNNCEHTSNKLTSVPKSLRGVSVEVGGVGGIKSLWNKGFYTIHFLPSPPSTSNVPVFIWKDAFGCCWLPVSGSRWWGCSVCGVVSVFFLSLRRC